MAKLERILHGDFNQWLGKIEDCILNGGVSGSLEDSSDFFSKDARCSVRVFEKRNYTDGNYVSLGVTLFQCGDEPIHLSATTAGGNKKMVFNTWGEEIFLEKIKEL